MGPIVADMSMSLDGFIADESDSVDQVFTWYGKPQPDPGPTPRDPDVSEELKTAVGLRHELGVIVYGRRTFEIAKGWGGSHPTGVPVVVISHSVPAGWPRDNMVRFASSIDDALGQARAIAGDKTIAIGSPAITGQLLDSGLLDGVRISLVPVFLGRGIRYFDNLSAAPIELEGPIVVEGNGVTHLSYRVLRDR
jgi:dihydrofolate reductase